MILLEATLGEKARLAGAFPNIIRGLGSKALTPHAQSLLAPVSTPGVHGLPRQWLADTTLAQRIANFHRPLSARAAALYEAFGESPVGEEILGLERVQHLADQRLGVSTLRELAAELGARVLAARQ